ncbi:MAG: hypothetical protein KJN66_03620 [Bacteroidia bacterium]|nr:hypothetical protein [Bacteroidia bacterium]
MKQKLMLKYFISGMMILVLANGFAQANAKDGDSIIYKQKYGLRVGGDAVKLVRSFTDENYKGFELNADYRITKNLYVAGELGTEEKFKDGDFFDATTTGSYFKAGVDYNVYDNWFGMDNLIFGGLRVGLSSFKQQLNGFTIYNTDQYWEPLTNPDTVEFTGLSAIWAELMIGIKVEVLTNVYVGFNAQLKSLISEDQPDNFENIYIPGFNKTYDTSSIGVGFGYNISYLIPLYKRDK